MEDTKPLPDTVTINTISANDTTAGATITATSEPTTLYEDDTNNGQGNYKITIDEKNATATTTGGTDDHPVQIQPNASIGFNWNINISNDTIHSVSSEPISISTISIGFKPIEKTAFAIYSEDDNSLDLYKRLNLPIEGDTFNGKTVTNIYTDFEEDNPIVDSSDTEHHYKKGYFHDVEDEAISISIIDDGISPTDISGWFAGFKKLKNVNNLQKFDMSRCISVSYLFVFDSSLERIDLSNWNCPVLTEIGGMFEQCTSLKVVNLDNLYAPKTTTMWFIFYNTRIPIIDMSSWTIGNVVVMNSAFASNSYLTSIKFPSDFSFKTVLFATALFAKCPSLALDCSDYDFPANTKHDDFNLDSPNVTLPSIWEIK